MLFTGTLFLAHVAERHFPHVFSLAFYETLGSHWFENALLELFSLQLCLFFVHKMMKFYKAIRIFFSYSNVNIIHKNIIEITSI